MSSFSYPTSVAELYSALSSCSKEEQILRAKKIANEYTRRHPILAGNISDLLILRHAFTFLPVKDISPYMGHFNAGLDSNNTKRLWLGEPPMWASAFRMLHAAHNQTVWRMIWSLRPEECVADGQKLHAKLVASMFCYIYDRDHQYKWKNNLLSGSFGTDLIHDCTWLQPDIVEGWNTLSLEQRQKTWMCLCTLGHQPTMLKFAKVLDFNAQYHLIDNIIGMDKFQQLKTSEQFDLLFKPKVAVELEVPEELFASTPVL